MATSLRLSLLPTLSVPGEAPLAHYRGRLSSQGDLPAGINEAGARGARPPFARRSPDEAAMIGDDSFEESMEATLKRIMTHPYSGREEGGGGRGVRAVRGSIFAGCSWGRPEE